MQSHMRTLAFRIVPDLLLIALLKYEVVRCDHRPLHDHTSGLSAWGKMYMQLNLRSDLSDEVQVQRAKSIKEMTTLDQVERKPRARYRRGRGDVDGELLDGRGVVKRRYAVCRIFEDPQEGIGDGVEGVVLVRFNVESQKVEL